MIKKTQKMKSIEIIIKLNENQGEDEDVKYNLTLL